MLIIWLIISLAEDHPHPASWPVGNGLHGRFPRARPGDAFWMSQSREVVQKTKLRPCLVPKIKIPKKISDTCMKT